VGENAVTRMSTLGTYMRFKGGTPKRCHDEKNPYDYDTGRDSGSLKDTAL